MKGITLQDCAAILGISEAAAANREREGSLPMIRVHDKSGDFCTDPGNAIDIYKAGLATGYRDADLTAQNRVLSAVDRKVAADAADRRRDAIERWDKDQALRTANDARYNVALEQASGMRTA